jgi:hypothetical protein
LNAYIRGGPEAMRRRAWLKTKSSWIAAGWQFRPERLSREWRALDRVAEEERFEASPAMRVGALTEAYLFAGSMVEEIEHAENRATRRDIEAAQGFASKILSRPEQFPVVAQLLDLQRNGRLLTQVSLFAELRPSVWCKSRKDLVWTAPDGELVEADLKIWTSWPRWSSRDDVVELAVKRGAVRQRALYRLIERASGGDHRCAILAVDPARSLDDCIVLDPDKPFEKVAELLVEIPESEMERATAEVEQALDEIAGV